MHSRCTPSAAYDAAPRSIFHDLFRYLQAFGLFLVAAHAGAQSPAPVTKENKTPASAAIPISDLPPRSPLAAAVRERIQQMTPLFDGVTLEGWIQAPVAPIRFAYEDVKDPAALARRLAQRFDPLTNFLSGTLDADARKAVAEIMAGPAVGRPAVNALLRSLNRVVAGESALFSEERFRGVSLRPEAKSLLGSSPSGWRVARLNRILLEDAFPAELMRSPAQAWVVKNGSMASTGAGRGVIHTAKQFGHYRLIFQVRQISGNHVPGVLIFGEQPLRDEIGLDALAAIQFQVPNGGHWDYRVGRNRAGEHFTRPVRIRFRPEEWAQIEMLVDSRNGRARMAVAQPVGTGGIEVLSFHDPSAGRVGPIAWQMHNAGLFDEFRDIRVEIDPIEDRLITVQ